MTCTMLDQRQRRWTDIIQMLYKYFVFAGNWRNMWTLSQQTETIFITFAQRRSNVFDVGPTLQKCYTNVLCLQG